MAAFTMALFAYLLFTLLLISRAGANNCVNKYNWMDVVFLADTSCPMTSTQCINQQQRIAKTLLSIKAADGSRWYPSIRAAYVEFGSTGVEVVVPLNQAPFNSRGGITNASIFEYFDVISQRCDHITGDRQGNPQLYDAIAAALHEFDTAPSSSDLKKDRKIVIFSNCPAADTQRICDKWKGLGRNAARDVDFFMINIGSEISDASLYIMCLVEYDDDELYVDIDRDDAVFYDDIMPRIGSELCDYPTPVPTTDPTVDPTQEPTADCHAHTMDVVILIDTATPMSAEECREQRERVADAMMQLKGMQDDVLIPNVRLSVIEVAAQDVYVRVAMDEYPYNKETGTNSARERNELHELIAASGECDETSPRQENANFRDGLSCALGQFTNAVRHKKILIFSNSGMNTTDADAVCQFYEENKTSEFTGVDIFIYHRNEMIGEDHLECLVNGDDHKILSNPTRDSTTFHTTILPDLEQFMCSQLDQ
eukprot:267088_1